MHAELLTPDKIEDPTDAPREMQGRSSISRTSTTRNGDHRMIHTKRLLLGRWRSSARPLREPNQVDNRA
jgi:hypothetical protein